MLSKKEKEVLKKGCKVIAGIDEVGRGALAGPVAAATVAILKPVKGFSDVKDSKQLSEEKREEIFEKAKNHPDIDWQVSFVWPEVIDKINIGQATIQTWQRSLKKLKTKPDFVFLDGRLKIPNLKIEQEAVIGGDCKIFVISLASIMAKVSRDRLMKKLAKKYPEYDLAIHKGYGTKLHLAKLKKHKPCLIHRRSYGPVFSSLSFADKVYFCVSKIPRGQTLSYRQVAEDIGHPRAFRAVGSALNRNKDPKVPCHRVIKCSGQIGGFNQGSRLKKKLLISENSDSITKKGK